VHESVDKAVLEPFARGYRAVTNPPVRQSVSNFLRNLRAPVIFLNDVLQGEPRRAGVTAARFGLNTTIGLFGILDPASNLGLKRHEEDFGQTMAVWGVPPGAYVFVPVLGPTNVRDGAGRIVDIALHPLTWSQFDGKGAFVATRTVATAAAGRESVLDAVEDMRATSLDPYVSIRTTYGLLRESAVNNGQRAPDAEGDSDSVGDYNVEPIPQDFNQGAAGAEQSDDADWGDSGWGADATDATEEAPTTDQDMVIGGVQ
jgi:phospholipid-binding lipoprotein MlaA